MNNILFNSDILCVNDRKQNLCWSWIKALRSLSNPQLPSAQREGPKAKHEMVGGQRYSNKARRNVMEGEEKNRFLSPSFIH